MILAYSRKVSNTFSYFKVKHVPCTKPIHYPYIVTYIPILIQKFLLFLCLIFVLFFFFIYWVNKKCVDRIIIFSFPGVWLTLDLILPFLLYLHFPTFPSISLHSNTFTTLFNALKLFISLLCKDCKGLIEYDMTI